MIKKNCSKKRLAKKILSVALLFCLIFQRVIAGEFNTWQLEARYVVTNTSDKEIASYPFGFFSAPIADDSEYQPGTKFEAFYPQDAIRIIEPDREWFFSNLSAGATQTVIMRWIFNNGAFNQELDIDTDSYKKALDAYTFVTSNIVYGEKTDIAEPEIANCQTFAEAFYAKLTAQGVPVRKVFGYAILPEQSDVTYNITKQNAHVWCEWQTENGEWIFCDPTFDAGKEAFEYFGQCAWNAPHIAMYYDLMPARFISANADHQAAVTWDTRITLRRNSDYIDENIATENLLERSAQTARTIETRYDK